MITKQELRKLTRDELEGIVVELSEEDYFLSEAIRMAIRAKDDEKLSICERRSKEAKEALDGFVKGKMAKYGTATEKEMFGKLDIMEKSEYLKKIEDHLYALDKECDETLASARSGKRKKN